LVSEEVEQCKSPEDQERIGQAVDQSASSICDYLGLSEEDIPSLVLFSLVDHRVFVFRYGGDGDTSPYQLFKDIAAHRPPGSQPVSWLTSAIVEVARDAGLRERPPLRLAPSSLATWEAIRYLPRQMPSKRPLSWWNRIPIITAHPVIAPLIVAAILAIAAGIAGYIKLSSSNSASPPLSAISGSPTQGFAAQVAWTNDGGGGGSKSTNLYAFAGPSSNLHAGVYPIGESLTVVCKVLHGRAVQVGPDYHGPNPHSIIWYQLDSGGWVPAVYVYVREANAMPVCS
jgi:hypothetical protein